MRQATQTGGAQYELSREAFADMERRYDALGIEVARLFPQLEFGRRLGQARVSEVAGALPEGAALVEFIRAPVLNFRAVPSRGDRRWSAERYFAFVLHASGSEPAFIHLGDAGPIDYYIESYRRAVTGVSHASPDLVIASPDWSYAAPCSTRCVTTQVVLDSSRKAQGFGEV